MDALDWGIQSDNSKHSLHRELEKRTFERGPDDTWQMKADMYKLGEYKIIESGSGELGWEAHFGLGEVKEGRCFKKGAILFIGPAENRCEGFLKLEFMAHLNGFPVWLKTKYYCRGFEIYHCKTGRKVTKEEMQLWMLGGDINKGDNRYLTNPEQLSDDISTRSATEDASCRLQRYEVIKKSNDQIIWKTDAGPSTFNGGTGIILEDILFMGLPQNEKTHLSKRQFLSNLEQLPEWNQTRYYSPKLSLHDCKTRGGIQEERKRWSGERRATEKNAAKKRCKNSTALKLRKSVLSEKTAMFFTHWARKWLTYVVDWILLNLPMFFAYLIRHWKKLKGRWH